MSLQDPNRVSATVAVNTDGSVTAAIAAVAALPAATLAADQAALAALVAILQTGMGTLVGQGASPTQAQVTAVNTALTNVVAANTTVIGDISLPPIGSARHLVVSWDKTHIQSVAGLKVALSAMVNHIAATGTLPATYKDLMP